jgi:WD40 repeat protein
VGTHEGAAIVYDLRTATRLYVLEGHFRAVTALSWSPDGRRLVSVSLEESKAVVWKVGVGILSMFTPGVAPRQGSGGTAKPFKTIDFNVGDESESKLLGSSVRGTEELVGLMTTAATLEWVAFEWPAERTTRLRIRETALTFSV